MAFAQYRFVKPTDLARYNGIPGTPRSIMHAEGVIRNLPNIFNVPAASRTAPRYTALGSGSFNIQFYLNDQFEFAMSSITRGMYVDAIPPRVDCARFVTAFENATNKRNFSGREDRIDFYTKAVYRGNLTAEQFIQVYNTTPPTWMSNQKINPNLQMSVSNSYRLLSGDYNFYNDYAKREYIDELRNYTDSFNKNTDKINRDRERPFLSYDQGQPLDIDETITFLLRLMVHRTRDQYQRPSTIAEMAYLCHHYEKKVIGNALILAAQNINREYEQRRRTAAKCQSAFKDAQTYLLMNGNLIEDEAVKANLVANKAEKIKNLDPNIMRSYITASMPKLKTMANFTDHFDDILELRMMSEVAYCSQKIEGPNAQYDYTVQLIKEIDPYVQRAIYDASATSCKQEELTQMDTDFNIRKGIAEARYANFLSVKEMKLDWEISYMENKTMDVAYMLDRVGKDLIDKAIESLVITDYLYSLNINESRNKMKTLCEKSSNNIFQRIGNSVAQDTSKFCDTFNQYVRGRMTLRTRIVRDYKKETEKKPLFENNTQCSKHVESLISNVFYPEKIKKYMADAGSPLPESGTYTYSLTGLMGTSSLKKKMSEQVFEIIKKEIFAADNSASSQFVTLVPLMFTPSFFKSFDFTCADGHLTTVGYGQHSQTVCKKLAIQAKAPSCVALKDELKELLIDNIVNVVNPKTYWFGGGFSEGLAKATMRFTEFWKEAYRSGDLAAVILESFGPSKVVTMANQSRANATVDRTFSGSDQEFYQMLHNEPKEYVRHLKLILKYYQYDADGNNVQQTYLKEFQGNSKFFCALYSKIDYEKAVVEPVIEKNLKVFKGFAKTVAILLTLASWILPPLGVAVSSAMITTFNVVAFGLGSVYNLADAEKTLNKAIEYSSKSASYMNACVSETLRRNPSSYSGDKGFTKAEAFCTSSKKFAEEYQVYKGKLIELGVTWAAEGAMYFAYTKFFNKLHNAHHADDAAHHAHDALEMSQKIGRTAGRGAEFVASKSAKVAKFMEDAAIKAFGEGGMEKMKVITRMPKGKFVRNLNTFIKTVQRGTNKLLFKVSKGKVGKFAKGLVGEFDHMFHSNGYAAVKSFKTAYYTYNVPKMGYLAYAAKNTVGAILFYSLYEGYIEDYIDQKIANGPAIDPSAAPVEFQMAIDKAYDSLSQKAKEDYYDDAKAYMENLVKDAKTEEEKEAIYQAELVRRMENGI